MEREENLNFPCLFSSSPPLPPKSSDDQSDFPNHTGLQQGQRNHPNGPGPEAVVSRGRHATGQGQLHMVQKRRARLQHRQSDPAAQRSRHGTRHQQLGDRGHEVQGLGHLQLCGEFPGKPSAGASSGRQHLPEQR